MKLTKRQKIYTAIVVVAVILIANIVNWPKPYTGVMGVNGGDPYEVVVEKLAEKGFSQNANPCKFVNSKGQTVHWSARDKWTQVECVFTPTNRLKSITLTKYDRLDYAPSIIQELERTFGKIQGDSRTYKDNGFYLFGKPWKTHATLNASDTPPFATISIEYQVKD